jgi:2-C-methyl-D-erythritol 4-phosphate cytidylyltransferase
MLLSNSKAIFKSFGRARLKAPLPTNEMILDTTVDDATHDQPRCYALIPCAGVGVRSGADVPKQYVLVAGQCVVAHTLNALRSVRRLSATLVVLAHDDHLFESLVNVPEAVRSTLWLSDCGGPSRVRSVMGGLKALRTRGAQDPDWVLVHDASRCLLRAVWVDRLIDACWDDKVGGLLALPLSDTLKQSHQTPARCEHTCDREGKWLAQTPQMFRLGLLEQALQRVLDTDAETQITDEASAIEKMGLSPLLVPGDWENFKLTWPSDFALAQRLLATRFDSPVFVLPPSSKHTINPVKERRRH